MGGRRRRRAAHRACRGRPAPRGSAAHNPLRGRRRRASWRAPGRRLKEGEEGPRGLLQSRHLTCCRRLPEGEQEGGEAGGGGNRVPNTGHGVWPKPCLWQIQKPCSQTTENVSEGRRVLEEEFTAGSAAESRVLPEIWGNSRSQDPNVSGGTPDAVDSTPPPPEAGPPPSGSTPLLPSVESCRPPEDHPSPPRDPRRRGG